MESRQAEIAAIEAGLVSRSEIVRQHGHDPDQVDLERQQERERERRLGLPPAGAAPATTGSSGRIVEEAE